MLCFGFDRVAWGVSKPNGSVSAQSKGTTERIMTIPVLRPNFKVEFGIEVNSSVGQRNVVTAVKPRSPADGKV